MNPANNGQPPPPPPPPPNPQAVLRRVLVFFIVLMILFAIAATSYTVWLLTRPFPQVEIRSLSVSNYNLSSENHLSANFTVGISFRNPDPRITVMYVEFVTFVFFKKLGLSKKFSPAPFSQSKKSVIRDIEATLNTTVVPIIGSDMRGQMSKNRKVNFKIKMFVLVQMKNGLGGMRKRHLIILCVDLWVGFPINNSSKGNLMNGPIACHLKTAT